MEIFRSHFDGKQREFSDMAAEAAIPDGPGESMTVQSQAEDADINVMLRRFGVLGQMPVADRLPEYGDFTGISDYQSALHAITEAEDRFLALEPKIRARFDNDPQLLLEFVSNPSNRPEGIKLGLFKELTDEERARSSGGAGETTGVNKGAPAGAGGANGGTVAGS